MSHTNQTTNYGLPQFVGTDKPTWLNDVNGAFSTVDTQMKANADSATQANTNATTAVTNTGDLTNLNTTNKTSLVSAVNEVNTTVGTVSGVASSASATATQANEKATTLENAFNMTQFGTIAKSDCTIVNLTGGGVGMRYAVNADGSIGKLYGTLQAFQPNNANQDATITFNTPFRPSQNIDINGACVMIEVGTSNTSTDAVISNFITTFKPNGDVTLTIGSYWYNRKLSFYFAPCLYFMKDFGDAPLNPEN